MQYHISHLQPAGDEAGRVLREQCHRLLELLRDWRADPADRIHRARQTCKKLRAVALVLRSGAPYVAQVENHFFRDIQKRLAYARDAEAMVEALDFLAAGVSDGRLLESIRMLRDSLVGRAGRGMEDHLPLLESQVALCCAELERAQRRLEQLPLDRLKRRDLRRGALRTWERCARQFAALDPGSAPEQFHRWRRHIKYAWHQTQLLAGLEPARAATLGPRLRQLGALLGHAQDLQLLDRLLQQQADGLGIDTHVQRLRRLIATALAGLRRSALDLGTGLFAGDGPPASAPAPVTKGKQSRKAPANLGPDHAALREGRPRSHREPDSPRRRQRQ